MQPNSKTLFTLIICSIFIVGIATTGHAAQIATLENVSGEVSVFASDGDDWFPALENMALVDGDRVRTTNGTCTVVYPNEGIFELSNDTELAIRDEIDNHVIDLKKGKVHSVINQLGAVKPFNVVTSVAVSAVRGTTVDIAFNGDDELEINLDNGDVYVYNDDTGLEIDLGDGSSIKIEYDEDTGEITVTNLGTECFDFIVQGTTYSLCENESQTVTIETAEGGGGGDDDDGGDDENPDEDDDDDDEKPPDGSPTTPDPRTTT